LYKFLESSDIRRVKMKKLLIGFLVVAVVISIMLTGIGCKGKAETATAEKKTFTIGYDIYYEGNVWSLQMVEEFKYHLEKEYSDMVKEVFYTSSGYDVTKQLNNFDDLVAKGCDIIFIQPLDPTALVDKIKEATAKGIYVIVFAIGMEGEDYTAYVNCDEVQIGQVKAEWMVKELNGKGQVVYMNGIAGTQTCIDMTTGWNSVIQKYPDIEVLPEVFTDWDYAKTKIEMTNVLQAYPDLSGVLSYDDPGAIAEAFIEANHAWMPITWEDENRAMRIWKENKDKGLKAIVQTKPASIGYDALKVGMAVLKGETYEKINIIPATVITEDEIDKYYKPNLPDQVYCLTTLPDDVLLELVGKVVQ
jgi:ribose transport system substrate-binding protein